MALSVRDLTVHYGSALALDSVTLSVPYGSSTALIGPNGAGKSTLLRAALGLVPITEGAIRILGRSPSSARQNVAYVPQADTLDGAFPVTALDVVVMGTYRRVGWIRRPGRKERDASVAALSAVRLDSRARDHFGSLSGGQRQRVLLARALVQESQLVLLDEPFTGVDAGTLEVLVDVLHQVCGRGAALVLATHDLGIAATLCTDAVMLDRLVVKAGPTAVVLR